MTTHSASCIPSVGCLSCTCPDCGRVGLPYVCGSPDDPDGGVTCAEIEAYATVERAKDKVYWDRLNRLGNRKAHLRF